VSALPVITQPRNSSSACCKRTSWTATGGTPARTYGSRSSPRSNAPTTDAVGERSSDGWSPSNSKQS
jgi:hypothetical protein